jgi:hypothetical protein
MLAVGGDYIRVSNTDNLNECAILSDRLDNFTVGLTNNSPASKNPVAYGYWLCARWPGVGLQGATMTLQCNASAPPARYVVVIGCCDALTVCELEVFAKRGNKTSQTYKYSLATAVSKEMSKLLNHLIHVLGIFWPSYQVP